MSAPNYLKRNSASKTAPSAKSETAEVALLEREMAEVAVTRSARA